MIPKRCLSLIASALTLLASVGAAHAQTNQSLGGGLEGVIDWGRSNAFVDMVKQSRGFFRPDGSEVPKDANGWPTQDCALILQTAGANEQAIYKGTYKFVFKGKADVRVELGGGQATGVTYNATTDTTAGSLTFDPGPGGNYFWVSFKNTNHGIKNLKVVRPGFATSTKQVFSNQFLNHVSRFNTLRFMDWKLTNGNQAATWAQRSKLTDACFTGPYGVPWESCIDLANTVNRDMWVNVPAHATDSYVKSLATLIKAKLKPELHVYVEYSNEVWNWGFEQATYNFNLAQAEVSAGGSDLQLPGETDKNPDGTWVHRYDFNYRRIAKKARQCGLIFRQVFGAAEFGNRYRPVFASQIGWPYVGQIALEWANQVYGPPKNYFYGYAGAPYFNLGDADSRTDLTVDQVLGALQSTVNSYTDYHGVGSMIAQYANMATYYGLKLLAYEGGPDTFGPNNIQAKKGASLDPRIRAICVQYLNNWYKAGGDLFNWFVIGATDYDTPYGTWGLTNDMTNTSAPKSLAMDDVLGVAKPEPTIGDAIPTTHDVRDYVGAPANWQTANPYLRWLGAGSAFDYLVRAKVAGTHRIRIKGATPLTGAKLEILVNNVSAGEITMPNTGSDEVFQWSPILNLPLNKGLNSVRLRVVTDRGYNLRALQVVGTTDGFPPDISALENQDSPLGTPTVPQSFTIGDIDTVLGSLTVTATSDNPSLVANSGIAFTGTGATRTVQVTPVSATAKGSALITVTVSDGTNASSSSFTVRFAAPVSGGLEGNYFRDTFSGPSILTRTDPTIDFNWGVNGPDATVGREWFSARWTGFVKPQFSQAYTFSITSDDGARLWVNGQLVIDDWNWHGPQEHSSAPINLVAGKPYVIRVEYFQGNNGAEMHLRWASSSTPKAIIPATRLFRFK